MLNLVRILSFLPLNYAELNATLWRSSTPEEEPVSTLCLIWCVCHPIMPSHKFSSWSDLWSNKLKGCVAHPSLAAWWIDVFFITSFPVSTPDFVHPRILHPLILILHCKVNVIWWVDSKTSPCSTFQYPSKINVFFSVQGSRILSINSRFAQPLEEYHILILHENSKPHFTSASTVIRLKSGCCLYDVSEVDQ